MKKFFLLFLLILSGIPDLSGNPFSDFDQESKSLNKIREEDLLKNYNLKIYDIYDRGDTKWHAVVNKFKFHRKIASLEKLYENEKENMDKPNKFGETPLHLASQAHCLEVVIFLLERGADVKLPNMYGNSPLHKVATSTNRGELPSKAKKKALNIVFCLISAGADLYLENEFGETPLKKMRAQNFFSEEEVNLFEKTCELLKKDINK